MIRYQSKITKKFENLDTTLHFFFWSTQPRLVLSSIERWIGRLQLPLNSTWTLKGSRDDRNTRHKMHLTLVNKIRCSDSYIQLHSIYPKRMTPLGHEIGGSQIVVPKSDSSLDYFIICPWSGHKQSKHKTCWVQPRQSHPQTHLAVSVTSNINRLLLLLRHHHHHADRYRLKVIQRDKLTEMRLTTHHDKLGQRMWWIHQH